MFVHYLADITLPNIAIVVLNIIKTRVDCVDGCRDTIH